MLAARLLALSVALGGHPSLAVDIPIEPERRAAFGLGTAWTAARRQGAPGATPWRWLATISGGRVLSTNTRLLGTGRRAPVVLNQAATLRVRTTRLPGRSRLRFDVRREERRRRRLGAI